MHCAAIEVRDKTVAKSLKRLRIDESLDTVDDALGLRTTDCCGQEPQDESNSRGQ